MNDSKHAYNDGESRRENGWIDAIANTDLRCAIAFDVPMSGLTTFRVGGPADIVLTPRSIHDIVALQKLRRETRMPLFILGAGANILVSDRGIRGIVLDMRNFSYAVGNGNTVVAGAGTDMSAVTGFALARRLSGIEFIHGMPGSVGGSIWMNARCYDRSICEVLRSTTIIDSDGDRVEIPNKGSGFSYKVSPFQTMDAVIIEAVFELRNGDPAEIAASMAAKFEDRRSKGHYLAPSVGSVFKNDRSFGAPTGKILDDLGLRGYTVGDAAIAGYHANIIVNNGGATASDILRIIEYAESTARARLGIELRREVILAGDWSAAADRIEESPK